MKNRNICILSFLLVFLSANPAMANFPPGPHEMLPMVLILPSMGFFTLIGGGYAEMKRRGIKSFGRVNSIAAVIFILVTTFFNISFMVSLIFACYAGYRGMLMFHWGIDYLLKQEKTEHSTDAKPKRWIAAGSLLILTTVFLVGMSFAFWNELYRFEHNRPSIEDRLNFLKELTAYQLAYARIQKSKKKPFLFDKSPLDKIKIFDESEKKFKKTPFLTKKNRGAISIEYDDSGQHFTLYMLPFEPIPIFPYSYLTSQPSYRTDETGNIRMISVHNKDHRCPAKAPIVMSIGKKEVDKAWTKYFAKKKTHKNAKGEAK